MHNYQQITERPSSYQQGETQTNLKIVENYRLPFEELDSKTSDIIGAPVEQKPDPRRLKLTAASSIKSSRTNWLWDGRIPLGTLTTFGAKGGEGKSTFALYISSMLNAGTLEGDLQGKPASVLIISHEDDWGTVMLPRLKAAGANLDMIYKLAVETTVDEVTLETVPALPTDLDKLREACEQTDAKMIIIDPIPSTIGGDLHKVADVRRALDPLAALAQELQIAIVGIMHFNKGAGHASDKLSGSHAFRDAVRSLLLFATDEETGQKIVTIDKSNYSQSQGHSFAFNLVSEEVYTDDGEQTAVGRVQYLGETDLNVSDIINRQPDVSDNQEDRNAAQQFIVDYLKQQSDLEGVAGAIIKAGRAAGFTENEIKNARRRGKNPEIKSQKASFGGGWVWALNYEELPQGVIQGVEDVGDQSPDPFDTFMTPSKTNLVSATPMRGENE